MAWKWLKNKKVKGGVKAPQGPARDKMMKSPTVAKGEPLPNGANVSRQQE